MKIPESVRIAGVEYAVIENPNLTKGNTLAYAHIDYENNIIEFSSTVTVAHEKKCLILWHEILHGITEHYGFSLGDDEETVIDKLAGGIYQVLQDNGRRLFDITEPSDAPPSEAGRTSCVEPTRCSYYSGFGCNLEPNQRPCKRKEPGNGG